jgi:hypothetical protein
MFIFIQVLIASFLQMMELILQVITLMDVQMTKEEDQMAQEEITDR